MGPWLGKSCRWSAVPVRQNGMGDGTYSCFFPTVSLGESLGSAFTFSHDCQKGPRFSVVCIAFTAQKRWLVLSVSSLPTRRRCEAVGRELGFWAMFSAGPSTTAGLPGDWYWFFFLA